MKYRARWPGIVTLMVCALSCAVVASSAELSPKKVTIAYSDTTASRVGTGAFLADGSVSDSFDRRLERQNRRR